MSEAPDPYLRLHAVRVFVRDQDRAPALLPRHARLRAGLRRQALLGRALGRGGPARRHGRALARRPEAEVARAQADRARHPGRLRDRGRSREVPRVAQTRRQVRPRAAPAAHQVPAAALGQSSEPRVQDRAGAGLGGRVRALPGRGRELVRARQLRRGVARRRGAAARRRGEARGRASRPSRARDRPAGPGPPLPPEPAGLAHAALRRPLHAGARGGRRLLRFPEPRPGAAGARRRRHRRQGHRGRAADGEPAGEPAQPVRHGARSARRSSCAR